MSMSITQLQMHMQKFTAGLILGKVGIVGQLPHSVYGAQTWTLTQWKKVMLSDALLFTIFPM